MRIPAEYIEKESRVCAKCHNSFTLVWEYYGYLDWIQTRESSGKKRIVRGGFIVEYWHPLKRARVRYAICDSKSRGSCGAGEYPLKAFYRGASGSVADLLKEPVIAQWAELVMETERVKEELRKLKRDEQEL